ncbi:neocarzinostatin apoprotein domain-containing protein [Jatrophihabitans sp. DSM 45814]
MEKSRSRKRHLGALVLSGALIVGGAVLSLSSQAGAAVGVAPGPSVTLSKSAGLLPAGDAVTISGSGFSTTGAGIYLGIADTAKFSPTNAAAFGAVKWIHPGGTASASEDALSADGTFSTTLNVAALFGSGSTATDCTIDECAVFTLAAHGSPDRSQDTESALTFFGPKLTLSAATALQPGQAVTVSGRGFKPGKGVYVAQTVAHPASGVPSNYANAQYVPAVGADGTFSTTVTLTATYTPARATEVTDCLAVSCYIASFNDHTDLANRDQDVWSPITFATSTPATSAPPTHAPGAIRVSVQPSSDLALDSATVTVTGSGFATTGNGIYVGVAATAKYDPTNADVFGAVKWVHLGASPGPGQDVLTADGSFTTTLSFPATFGSGTNATDCTVTQCAIYTLAAHGSPDRSQDTHTVITFAGFPNPGQAGPSSSPTRSASTSAAIALSDTTVQPGGNFIVTASGFDAGEQVQAILHSDPIDLGISQASSTGTYRLSVSVPVDLSAGVHTVNLLGLSSAKTVQATFTVLNPAAALDRTSSSAPVALLDPGMSGSLASTGASSKTALLLGIALVLAGCGVLMASTLRRPAGSARYR